MGVRFTVSLSIIRWKVRSVVKTPSVPRTKKEKTSQHDSVNHISVCFVIGLLRHRAGIGSMFSNTERAISMIRNRLLLPCVIRLWFCDRMRSSRVIKFMRRLLWMLNENGHICPLMNWKYWLVPNICEHRFIVGKNVDRNKYLLSSFQLLNMLFHVIGLWYKKPNLCK